MALSDRCRLFSNFSLFSNSLLEHFLLMYVLVSTNGLLCFVLCDVSRMSIQNERFRFFGYVSWFVLIQSSIPFVSSVSFVFALEEWSCFRDIDLMWPLLMLFSPFSWWFTALHIFLDSLASNNARKNPLVDPSFWDALTHFDAARKWKLLTINLKEPWFSYISDRRIRVCNYKS